MNGDSQHSPSDDFPERDIVRCALRGNPTAFHDVVKLYSRRLYAVAYGVVQDRAEAEDVVQETFLKAHARRWMIRDPDKFPAWLCRTARNLALDITRKHRAESLPHDDVTLLQAVDQSVPTPSANLRRIERNGAVERLLHTLPEHHRIAITLRFMEGLGYREIEEAMSLDHGALRGILARAMKTLRKGIGAALQSEQMKVCL